MSPVLPRRRLLLSAALAPVAAAALPRPALSVIADARPVRLVVPYPAGGAVDLVGRLLAPGMEASLGQPVVVENRSGAAGIVGADAVAKARSDGTTLGIIGMTTLCAYPALYRRLPFDPQRDFAPVSQVSAGTVVCAVNKAAAARQGWTDFPALVAWAKANPDGLRFGTAGVGTTAHLTMAAIQKATGLQALHVTYRGGAPAVADLQAGVIDMMFELTPGLMPLIAQDEITPLAVGSARRLPVLPQVPGMAEFGALGLDGLDIGAWEAVMAPAATPAETIAALHAAVRSAGEDATMRAKLRETGFVVETSATPAALRDRILRETPMWRRLVETSGATLD
ncbi:MAG: tripartite tricarboxylate transporter substrate binding protein [Acetobacteraceae bacterium]|nr:tripartite tricarboxylate transporter substrate binding protein [Acetobacteraceae bacterium]